MKTTLLGREVELITEIPEGVIRMHPETWHNISAIAFRNSVKVTSEYTAKAEGELNVSK